MERKHSLLANTLRHRGAIYPLLFRTSLIFVALCLLSTFFLLTSKSTHAAALHPNQVQCQDVIIQSAANNKFVTAELGGTGDAYARLRARSNLAGSWESFTICTDDSTGNTTIQSQANGLYVTAEVDFTGDNYGLLRARASTPGPWEQFGLIHLADGNYVIQSRANNLYVSAELGGTGDAYARLRARASAPGAWEKFIFPQSL